MVSTTTKSTTAIIEFLYVCFILTVAFIRMTQRGWKLGKNWLYTEHDYSNEEGEIHMTGWQFLGLGLVISLVTLALSINF